MADAYCASIAELRVRDAEINGYRDADLAAIRGVSYKNCVEGRRLASYRNVDH